MPFEYYNLQKNLENANLSSETEKQNKETKEKKLSIIKKLKEFFKNIHVPHAFLVFGSVGRGKPRQDSDIDLMFIFNDHDTKKIINDEFLKKLP
ncbi:MAG: nucleotidyltransferase domain-containing protein, partial [Patescibacteria group bacterium]|nr:nucleotidyltransferase domain-containing protein [Patescibacteria group bacterium]